MKESYLIAILYILAIIRLLVCIAPKIVPASWRKTVREYLDSFIVAGMVAIVLITFLVRSFYIPSESMVPTLLVNDYILVNKFAYKFAEPMRGDIIVFHPPHIKNPRSTDFIKRCVAVENDVIVIRDGQFYLNGIAVEEPFINQPPIEDFGPYRVPPGHIFMMGDNRNNSDDSRNWGPLPLQNVVGKAFVIFWPMKRACLLRHETQGVNVNNTINLSKTQRITPDMRLYTPEYIRIVE